MSELKVYKFLGIDEVYPDANLGSEYYPKSEADKVIAEKDEEIYNIKYSRDEWAKACNQKDKEIAQLQAMLEERNRQIGNLDAIAKRNQIAAQTLRKKMNHHRYKRCLTMAKWCYSMDCKMLDEAAENGTYFKDSWFWKRASWYGKWKRKWLELAEKFKEAK